MRILVGLSRIAVLAAVVLVGSPAPPAASPAAAPCYPVSGYENHTTVHPGNGLTVWMGVDRAAYDLGDTVRFCLVLQNEGSDTLRWGAEYAPIHRFEILPDTCGALDQPGCNWATVCNVPGYILWFGETIVLAPGECEVRTEFWDGRIPVEFDPLVMGYPDPGGYTVWGGIWRFTGGEPFPGHEYYAPPGGAQLSITLGPDVPVQPTSWGRLKTLYR